jgi:hypothetical protein
MNKFTVFVVLLFFIVMGVLFYDSGSDHELENVRKEKQEINLIKPPKVVEPNEDVVKNNSNLALSFSNTNKTDNKNKRVPKAERKETYEYPFTKEGQAFVTRGELLLQGHKHVHADNYSEDLFKQLEQAKYNLKLAKEIAVLSKKLYIDTDEGKVMNQEVYAKINELSMNLIVTVKKQQNLE